MNSSKGPYRVHHDWRFWVGLVLMMAAIAMFALRRDMVLLPGSR